MEQIEFEKLVVEGIKLIPEKLKAKIENVGFVVEKKPSAKLLKNLKLPPKALLFGLYQGIPQTKRGAGYTLVLLDKITIFQGPIEQVTKTKDDIKKMVTKTVSHEVAHHFGLDEARIRAIELKKESQI